MANGFLACLLDPAAFAGSEFVEDQLQGLSRWVKSSRLRQGFHAIQLPGEPEATARSHRTPSGLPIDETTWQKICDIAVARSVGIPEVTPVPKTP